MNPRQNTCTRCRQPFLARRSDATYCSDICRALASRERRRIVPPQQPPQQPPPAARGLAVGAETTELAKLTAKDWRIWTLNLETLTADHGYLEEGVDHLRAEVKALKKEQAEAARERAELQQRVAFLEELTESLVAMLRG